MVNQLIYYMFFKYHKLILIVLLSIQLIGCQSSSHSIFVQNELELNSAIENAIPGDNIIMSNGIWKDIEIKFIAQGTKDKPITIKAETSGEVFIEGISNLKFGGDYLIVDGVHFRNGYSPSNAVVEYRVNDQLIANHCTLTNSVIEDFNKLSRDEMDRWVQFWGRHNTLSNCYIAGKVNRGPTVRVDLGGNEHIFNYHQIVNNHFGPKPPKGGARGETIQIGDSSTSNTPSHTYVANNLFDRCNGEIEIISVKSHNNVFKSNVFYMSEGSLVARHGNYNTIVGNFFIGDGVNENIGGIRVINTGHWIYNNYFFNLKGKQFRSPIAVMNGIPKASQNRYHQVTDVVVAYNSFVNCESPWQFNVGVNLDQKKVLPKSEIRSARPKRTIFANNVIYNEHTDNSPIVVLDKIEDVAFENNIIHNQNASVDYLGRLISKEFDIKKVSDFIYSTENIKEVKPFNGFEFEKIESDIFGNTRNNHNKVGAFVASLKDPDILNQSNYGPEWFSIEQKKEPKSHHLSSNDDIQSAIDHAENGDTLILDEGVYTINQSLVISKKISITSKNDTTVLLKYESTENTPLFELHPKGFLQLKNINIKGNMEQYAFAPLEKNMYTHYGLEVIGCEITDFKSVLKSYKQSFSERITFKKSKISNSEDGLELASEIDALGDYNTEYLTVDECSFENVKSNVIDYYRGGYDESTIGGNLIVTNSNFTQCGSEDSRGILINNKGIVNVSIKDNVFKNNSVNLVALLWGAKNNTHANNTFVNSASIEVQKNIKLDVIY